MIEQTEKITVVIVEDHREMREGLESIVKWHQGLECLAAYASAEAALEHIHKNIPDIVLMDIHLPVPGWLTHVVSHRPETVTTHIHHIYEKLYVQSRTEAINKVFPGLLFPVRLTDPRLRSGGIP